MLNSKQRSFLRSLANELNPMLLIGKGGIDENVIKQVDDILEARELIKIGILKNSMMDPREACRIICDATGSDPVQVIGNRFIIYRPSKEKPKIILKDEA